MPKRVNRRDVIRATGFMTALGFTPVPGVAFAPKAGSDATIYTKIGASPFINLTATFTINGGALTRPEVKRAMEEASYWPVNIDELMNKVGEHLAKLLGSESAMVTSGCAAALCHGTAGSITGTDPEKLQQLPDLTGLKNEVVIPRQSRNPYDHAFRMSGAKIVEVETPDQLATAVNQRTAAIAMLGTGEANGPIKLEHLVAAGNKFGVPVIVDAAAELPVVPNPYLSRGASMVAYSGGKFLRGPQSAGLLLGKRDCIRAAWANSSPHDAFGRPMKVGKEEIMGMVAAIEVWRNNYDLEGDYSRWRGYLTEIGDEISKVPTVAVEYKKPAGASPFPVMNVSWDPSVIGYTAGEIGEQLLNGTPRIMSHAEGQGHGFMIRPVAMKEGEAKLVARRLTEILRAAPKPNPTGGQIKPEVDLTGSWTIDIQFTVGSTRHTMAVTTQGNKIGGSYQGRLAKSPLTGHIDGSDVRLSSSIRYQGTSLAYDFHGKAKEGRIEGEVSFGEYGKGKFIARRA